MSEVWALFSKKRKGEKTWKFDGLTEHEEIAVEHEDLSDEDEVRVSFCLDVKVRDEFR